MNIIVAINNLNGIGCNGSIPWHNKNDLQFFKLMTYGNNVYMGGKTYDSLGGQLKDRCNYVLSRTKRKDVYTYTDPDKFTTAILNDPSGFIIGGESIYDMALRYNVVSNIYLSRINDNSPCDKFFYVPHSFKLISAVRLEGLIVERYSSKFKNKLYRII